MMLALLVAHVRASNRTISVSYDESPVKDRLDDAGIVPVAICAIVKAADGVAGVAQLGIPPATVRTCALEPVIKLSLLVREHQEVSCNFFVLTPLRDTDGL